MMPAEEPSPRSTLSVGRKLLFALLPLLLLIVLGEVVLRTFVPRDPTEVLHSSRGFDAGAHYLVPDPAVPGGWVTQIYGEPERETTIPPRSDRLRVLLFGGSNTRGFPQSRLERLLDDASAREGIDWEVFNLGREGYGSRRVAYLFEQAMAVDPDVVLVYSGHNEFVELGFERELGRTSRAVSILSDALSELRLFDLLVGALRSEDAGPPPADLDRADPSQRELPWQETLAVYERYRENLGLMCEIAAQHDVPMVLCTVVTNMIWLPRVWTPSEPLDEDAETEHERLMVSSVRLIPERFRSALLPTIRLRGVNWRTGGSERSADSIPRLRELQPPLERNPMVPAGVVDAVRRRSFWYDPAKWDPKVPQVIDWYAAVMFPDPTPAELEDLQRAATMLRGVIEAIPDEPRAMFLLGMVSWLGGQRTEAVALWRRAATFDRSPNNANDRSNGIVRDVAEQHPWVTLFDADALYRSRCPDGVVGYEVMMDACHLQPGARYVLMADLTELLQKLDLR